MPTNGKKCEDGFLGNLGRSWISEKTTLHADSELADRICVVIRPARLNGIETVDDKIDGKFFDDGVRVPFADREPTTSRRIARVHIKQDICTIEKRSSDTRHDDTRSSNVPLW